MKLVTFTDHVANKIAECINIAEKHLGKPFPMPEVDFSLRGTCAGRYSVKGEKHIIKVNRDLALANLKEYMSETIPHEVAHYVTRLHYGYTYRGSRVTAHGDEWEYVMTSVFRLAPKQYHSYNTNN